MKQRLIALAMTMAVAAGVLQGAPASAQEAQVPDEPAAASSSSSSSEGGSSEGTIITVAAVAALATAVGGGTMWAVQQGLIANPLPGIIPGPPQYAPVPAPAPAPAPARGACSNQAFNEALWEWRDSYRTNIQYCDGSFAWVSQNQTDWRVAFEFDGQRWQVLRSAGTTKTGMTQGCYNGIELRNKGATNDFISRLPICTPDEIGYSPR